LSRKWCHVWHFQELRRQFQLVSKPTPANGSGIGKIAGIVLDPRKWETCQGGRQ
jgi:hypothetical protein